MPTRRQLIQKIELNADASSVTFSNIPQNYTDLKLCISARSNYTGGGENVIYCNANGETPTRTNRYLTATGTSVSSNTTTGGIWLGTATNDAATANTFSSIETYIPNYAGSTNKSFSSTSVSERNSATGNQMFRFASLWQSTNAIASLTLQPESYNFKSGSTFYLYGITHVPIIRGGEVSIAGGYKIHTFKSSGSLQVVEGGQVEYLVVAGGGGGSQGGGGAGGYRSSVGAENSGGGILSEPKCILAPNKYTITVGGGGSGGPYFNAGVTGGSDSSISGSGLSSITSIGGGRGANGRLLAGGTGGSGGGGSFNNVSLGSGTTGQGYSGGAAFSQNDAGGGGGGGGASSAGGAATRVGVENANGGNGGNGVSSSITGYAITRAGGGGGRAQGPGTVGAGGSGGGGAGTKTDIAGESGVVNTGSGGGGTGSVNGVITGGAGGSGIVIIRYPYDGN